jgi:hypothetical protein
MTAALAHLTMHFRPTYELITTAREFVTRFYDAILDDPDATSRVALTAQELLENATKYSTDGATTLEIDVTREGAGHVLSVRTSNGADPEHLAELQRRFDTMQRSSDAFGYYTDLMVRTAKSREGSGLGLARVWAEGEMDVRCNIVGTEATIIARTNVGLRKKPVGHRPHA